MTPSKTGTLFVVATPIGNLGDWPHRAAETLRDAGLVLCEDTRHTRKLLAHYQIRVPVESYHDFNEAQKTESLIDRLRAGLTAALVSDAGTPAISDPGYRIVRACRENGIDVVPVPGPSAAIAALSVSGLPTDEFRFVGFLPPRKDARKRRLGELAAETATLIFYEAPHRLAAMLADARDVLGDREAFLGREMTKMHEDYRFARLGELAGQVTARGEAVVVIAGAGAGGKAADDAIDLEGMSRKEILKAAAERLGVSRNRLYDALFRKEED